MMNFAYIIGDPDSGVCAVVDPGFETEKIVAQSNGLGFKIEKILLTHTHFDHATATSDLAKITGATVYVHRNELEDVPKDLKTVATDEGSVINIGSVKVTCLHTPGHTPGSQCFLVNGSVITGDTLFVDGCGRVDLPGSDPKMMIKSLSRLAGLDPKIVVYPGHDYGPAPTSTIGEQIKNNPYLTAKIEDVLL